MHNKGLFALWITLVENIQTKNDTAAVIKLK